MEKQLPNGWCDYHLSTKLKEIYSINQALTLTHNIRVLNLPERLITMLSSGKRGDLGLDQLMDMSIKEVVQTYGVGDIYWRYLHYALKEAEKTEAPICTITNISILSTTRDKYKLETDLHEIYLQDIYDSKFMETMFKLVGYKVIRKSEIPVSEWRKNRRIREDMLAFVNGKYVSDSYIVKDEDILHFQFPSPPSINTQLSESARL